MPAEPPFDLEETLPYLLNRAGVRIGLTFADEIDRFGVSLAEWRMLASLLARDPQTVSELAARTSAEISRASRTVASLVERKLLKRKSSGEDRRALAISLTAAGRALAEQIVPIARLYEKVALAGLDAQEAETLKRLLRKLFENMDGLGTQRRSRPQLTI